MRDVRRAVGTWITLSLTLLAPVARLRAEPSVEGAGAPRPPAARARRGAALEPDRDRRERSRSHAASRPARPSRLRRAARPRPLEPRDGDRAHRDLRRRERASRAATRATPACRAPPGDARSTPPSRRRRTTRSWRCSRRSGALRRVPRRGPDADSPAQRRRARARARARTARGERDSRRCARTTARATPSRTIGIDFFPSDRPGWWRQDPISQIPVALGAHWGEVTPVRARLGRPVPRAAAARADERRVRGRLRRGEGLGGDGVVDADAAHGRADADRHLLGVRRHAEPVRAAAALQPDRGRDRRQAAHGRVAARAPARARERRDGRRRHRDLGVEVPLPALAARHRHPRVGPGHRARPGSATATPTPSAIRPSRRSARRPATCTGPNFTPPFPAYPSGHAGFGGALFQTLRRFYGTDEIAFTFVSDEFNGETRGNDGMVRPLLPAHLRVALAGRGGERPEPHLPRHPLVVRQDRGHRAGPRGGDYVFDHLYRARGADYLLAVVERLALALGGDVRLQRAHAGIVGARAACRARGARCTS